jgi:hypothetical protein
MHGVFFIENLFGFFVFAGVHYVGIEARRSA